jgi:putative spermidine/putrescine transport system ATP-binding protein
MVTFAETSLALRGVTKQFNGFTAVYPLDLDLDGGEMVALLGPSGCGKTTTLRIIAGFETPDTGQVLIAGRDVTHLRPRQRRLGMVFQNYSLFPHMTVAENVAFGLRMQGTSRADRDTLVREMLDLVQLSSLADRHPRQISGGQQQRVALARSLVVRPQLLLLDEPLGALDKNLRESMQFELRDLQRRLRITSLLVTHDQEEALSMSDRVAVMRAGRIAQIGAPNAIYHRPRTHFVATFLGTSNIISGRASDDHEMLAGPDDGTRVVLPVATGSAQVTLSLRPERVVLGQAAEALPNHFSASVRTVAFRGAYAAYELTVPALGRDDFYVYRHVEGGSREGLYPAGSAVEIGWHPDDGVIVEEDA